MLINVTVGIPTYNRPEGLRLTLESIASQTKLPAEVIISDNASTTAEAADIAEKYRGHLPDLRYFRQPENIGPINNFLWLLDAAQQPYFTWLADDDQWGNNTYLEALHSRIHADPSLLMVFPDVDIFIGKDKHKTWTRSIHSERYQDCTSDWDYIKAFSSYGGGHCFYGLYDKEKLVSLDPRLLLDPSLAYFTEGRYLHALFLHGGVRFEPNASMHCDATMATKLSNKVLLAAFMTYSIKVHAQYMRSNLSFIEKLTLLRSIALSHYPYILHLWCKQ